MKFLYSDEPIIACSTSNLANAAMAVIRISGFRDFSQFSQFFTLYAPIEPRRVYYTRLVSDGVFIDDICLTYFAGPKSYNGENILELSVHGNTLNIERIIQIFTKFAGCREAAPGEFTYRALRNKKLSLSQVEGLDLFLNANSGFALDQGLSLLNGNLHETYQELYELFLKHKAALELSIDFLEDIGEAGAKAYFDSTLKAFREKLDTLVRRVAPMDSHLIQPEIVLAGMPNAGKSSLFNFLLRDERAIVSPIAGTTRDYISESLVVGGVKYKLFDTAGIRLAEDTIEVEGIRRAGKKIAQSFFSLLLINPFEANDGFEELLKYNFDLIYFTHSDLPGFAEARKNFEIRFTLPGSIGAANLRQLDAQWESELFTKLNNKYLFAVSKQPLFLERHKTLILQSDQISSHYVNTAAYETDIAILSSELNTLGHCISELIGIVSPDQILNSIFSSFCIGK